MERMKIDRKGLLHQVKGVITAGDFYEMAEGAQIIFT